MVELQHGNHYSQKTNSAACLYFASGSVVKPDGYSIYKTFVLYLVSPLWNNYTYKYQDIKSMTQSTTDSWIAKYVIMSKVEQM